MRIWFMLRKTSQYGSIPNSGIHLKQPTDREITDALEWALRDGFTAIFIYHSKRKVSHLRDLLIDYNPVLVGRTI